jgi:hypothetical protein
VWLVTQVVGKSVRGGVPWYYLDDGLYGSFSGKVFDQCEYAIQSERDGERERTTGNQEEGEEQKRHAATFPQNQRKRLRIGRCEQTRAKYEDEKSRKTGKKRWHWTRI